MRVCTQYVYFITYRSFTILNFGILVYKSKGLQSSAPVGAPLCTGTPMNLNRIESNGQNSYMNRGLCK